MYPRSTTDYGTLSTRLETFVKCFVEQFEAKLLLYHLILEGEVKKAGKFSDFFSEKLGLLLGGAVGAGAGICVGLSAQLGVCGAELGKFGAEYLGDKFGNEKSIKKAINLKDLIDVLQTDRDRIRLELITAGVEIFRSFEMQFMKLTTEKGEEYAMKYLAMDASNRALDYYVQKRNESIAEGILKGRSKLEPILGVPIFTKIFNTYGSELMYNGKKLRTGFLYEKVGIVVEGNVPGENRYYEQKNGENETCKYGYRRLLTSEKWDSLEKEYKKSNVLKSKEFTDYQYRLGSEELESKSKDILEKISRVDKSIGEEELKELIKELRKGVLDAIRPLKQEIEKNFEVLRNVEANLQELNLDEYALKYSKELKSGFQEIHKSIEASGENIKNEVVETRREIKDGQEENMRAHRESQEGIKQVLQGIKILKPNLAQTRIREPIWFDVKESLISFTGRQDQLNQIASDIKQGMLVITGLNGVGKTELAVKHARLEYTQDDDVIWINAETSDTAKDSFYRLSKKLNVPKDDADSEEEIIKSIIEKICIPSSGGKKLMIFDNAENYGEIEKFLPLGLPVTVKRPFILVTSPNSEDWKSPRIEIKSLQLNDFTDEEATEFIKKSLNISDDSQDEDVKKLAKKLHNFPLILQQAVACIKDTNESYKKRSKDYKVKDYLEEYEKTPKSLLNLNLPPDISESIVKSLKVILDKIKKENHGQECLDMLNIISYFAQGNIPEEMFLKELANGDEKKLFSITNTLVKYSIVSLEKEMLRVHGLVKQVINDNEKALEEETLARALKLLKDHMKECNDVQNYAPHIRSVWNTARKHEKLIENFIVKDIDDKEAQTTYFNVIAEYSSYEVVEDIIEKLERNHHSKLIEVINAEDKETRNPLHNSALNGDERIMKILIEKGADINAKIMNCWTPLHLAAKNGFLEVVKILLEKNVNVNDVTGYNYTPLHLAARNGFPEIVRILMSKNANVNAEDQHKFTPLHFGVKMNHEEVVRALLEHHEVNVNAETGEKFTPLHYAARVGNIDIAEALLKKVVNVNMKINEEPLSLSSEIEVSNEVIRKDEINVNAQTAIGFTALHFASKHGYLEIVKALMDNNADVNVEDRNKFTPLHFAVKMNHYEVVLALLENDKVNVNCKTKFEFTPLLFAAKGGYPNIVKALLDKGAIVNTMNSDNFTPLHYSALYNQVEILNELLSRPEIQINVRTTKGNTPLQLAMQERHAEIVKILMNKNADVNV